MLSPIRTYWLWTLIVVVFITAFVCLPGETAGKSRALLHGLCAQTPTHTFRFDNVGLPFDARMTGIYCGSLITLTTLILRRRIMFYGNPSRPIVIGLGAGVATMGADGMNSLLTDLRLWHPWTSTNETRFLTGYATGVGLAVALCWLLASSLWRMSASDAGVRSWRDLLPTASVCLPLLLLLQRGPDAIGVPITWILMIAAWMTISLLMLAAVLLGLRMEDRIVSLRQLHLPGAVAATIAMIGMLVLAGGRFWLEQEMGFAIPV